MEPQLPAFCIYHDGCNDGSMAAGIVHHVFDGNVFMHPGRYGHTAPDVMGRDVYIVDFSYAPAVIMEMLELGNRVTVIDHHKGVEEQLRAIKHDRFTFIFDNERSGAGLVWDHFYPGQPRPSVVQAVEDRDLWRLDRPHTRQIHMALQLLHKNAIHKWASLIEGGDTDFAVMLAHGEPILRFFDIQVDSLVERHHWLLLGGKWVPAQNCPAIYASDVAGKLAETNKGAFGATYYLDGKLAHISLRSRNEFDVSEVARLYGGNGHVRASGCVIPWEELNISKKEPFAEEDDF